ncbi:MAG: hypothetical protein KC438_01045 [Thermomicrobiales bacterium]|nr:hypothetical protein [Thermomicrobiales bacterium]
MPESRPVFTEADPDDFDLLFGTSLLGWGRDRTRSVLLDQAIRAGEKRTRLCCGAIKTERSRLTDVERRIETAAGAALRGNIGFPLGGVMVMIGAVRARRALFAVMSGLSGGTGVLVIGIASAGDTGFDRAEKDRMRSDGRIALHRDRQKRQDHDCDDHSVEEATQTDQQAGVHGIVSTLLVREGAKIERPQHTPEIATLDTGCRTLDP